MQKRSSKAFDPNLIAARVLEESIKPGNEAKNPAAVALGRLGGLKGGKARTEALSPKRRSEIARKAAVKRWSSAHRSKGQRG